MTSLQVTSTCKTNSLCTKKETQVLGKNLGTHCSYEPFYPACGTFGGSGYAYEANLSKNGDK